MPSRAQRIGKMAEEQVKTWAAEQGIVATRPDEDRMGWDLLLELPAISGQAGAKCLVQVKASDNPRGRCGVRLDTWIRLVRTPMPCFFLVLDYGGKGVPKHLYVVHVWEEWIGRALKRLRAEELRGTTSLRQMELVLRWGTAEEVAELSGAGLLSALQRAAGSDPYDYISNKRSLLGTVGYDAKHTSGTFCITGTTSADINRRLADHAIGITPFLEASSLTMNEERFGISVPQDFGPVRYPMKMQIRPAAVEVSVRFQNGDASRVVHESAKLLAAVAAFPFLPPAYHKMRITAEFVTITLDPEIQKMQVEARLPDSTCKTTIGAAYRAATLLRMTIEQPKNHLCIEILTPVGPLVFGREKVTSASADPGAMPKIEAIEACSQLLKEYGLPETELVTVGDIYDLAEEVRSLLSFHHPAPEAVTFAGTMFGAPDSDVGPAAVVFAKGLTLGERVLAGVFTVKGQGRFGRMPSHDDRWGCEITGGRMECCERIALSAGHDPLKRLQRGVDAARDRLVEAGVPTVVQFPAR